MRTAFVQLGSGHEPLAAQAARLKPLTPDAYHIEDAPSVAGARRLTERLETLKAGDELLLTSLHSLGMELGDLITTLGDLLERGVALTLCRAQGTLVRIRPGGAGAALLAMLAGAQSGACAVSARPRGEAERLLSEAEVADIRRLFKAGLTPRRIGLIYRRSPKCISDLLAGRGAESPGAGAAPASRTQARAQRVG